MLAVGEAAALAQVGFDQVSEVVGATAFMVPPRSFFAYGTGAFYTPSLPVDWQGTADGGEPVVLTSSTQRNGRVPSSITAIRSGYRDALRRLVDEVRAVGADGAVGVQVRRTTIDEEATGRVVWNFLATGTAVRSRGRTRAKNPFTCALGAAQAAAALRAGWLPLRFLACPVMAVRWLEPEQRSSARFTAPNAELDALTKTVNVCRHQARTDFAASAAKIGGDGAIMSDMSLEIAHQPTLVQATVLLTGTALLDIGHRPPPEGRLTLSLADKR